MKEKTVMKRCLALVLTFVLVLSGLTIPKGDVTVAEAAEETAIATNIVGDEGATAENSEAKIGDAYFLKFANAVAQANQANGDVTIELLKDISLDTADLTKKMTIDGNDHKITASKAAHMFFVKVADIVEFKNLTFNFGYNWNPINIQKDGADVRLTNVTINYTGNFDYAVINMQVSNTALTKLTLTDVKVYVDVSAGADRSGKNPGIIYTKDGSKVSIKAENCIFDTSESANANGELTGEEHRSGITITATTEATVELINTKIYTYDTAPIRDLSGNAKITMDDKCELHCDTKDAQVGNTLYDSFASAVNAAEEGDTIEILRDITLGTLENSGVDNHDTASAGYISITKPITIDGNEHKVTNYAKHGFRINFTGIVTMRNMTLDCYQQQSVIQVNSQATVNLSDIQINAKGTSTGAIEYYRYGLIAIPESTSVSEVTLNFTRVNVVMDTPAQSGSWSGVVRTGNDSDTIFRTINMNLNDCNWNLTAAPKRKGFAICNGTTANITMTDSTISTDGTTADSHIIATGSKATTNLTKTNSTFSNETYVAQVGNTLYTDLASAVSNAPAGSTIEVLKESTVSNVDITKKLTIDGNEHIITTTNQNAFKINVADIVEFKNMKFDFRTAYNSIRIETAGADVRLTKVNITCPGNFDYAHMNILATGDALTKLTLTEVYVYVDVAADATQRPSSNDAGIIRTGNGDNNVYIKAENCVFDTSAGEIVDSATGQTGEENRSGIVVYSSTNATIELVNTKIYTYNAAPIKDLSGKANITMDDDCVVGCDTKDAQIGTEVGDLSTIISKASETETDVTIELLRDCTINYCDIYNKNGKNITIDGNSYTVTTDGDAYTEANAWGHGFRIYGSSDGTGTYEFKNMTLVHGKSANLIQINASGEYTTKKSTFKFTNVDIRNTKNGGWRFGLINALPNGEDANMTLDFSDVNVTMKFDSDDLGTGDGAIIRTGNAAEKTVSINLTNCNFDTTEAAKMRGILVHDYATAIINIAGESSIKTKNVAPIEAYENATASTITLDDTCVFDSNAEEIKKTLIKGYDAQVGNVVYLDFADAVAAANTMDDATIELLRDITLGTLKNSGVDNHDTASIGSVSITKQVTINGNKHKVTNYAKHGFRINCAGTVTMRDMTLDCYQQQSVIQVNSQATVNLSDIQINAKGTSTGAIEYYRYGLIAIPESTSVSEVTLNFTRVNVVMDTPAQSGSWSGVVRTGNDSDTIFRTINMNLNDCNWNLTAAPKRKGFAICNGTTANITMTDSTISTDGTTADSHIIATGSKATTNLTKTNSTFSNETYEAQIGNTLCTFAEAMQQAKDTSSNATIEVLTDITINACDIYNMNSKDITIDGNHHTVTTVVEGDDYNTATNAYGNAFRIYGSADGYGTYEFKNMDIVHAKPGVLVQVHSTGDYTSKNATVKFTNVDITTKKENQDGTVVYGGGNYGLITTLPATLFSEDGITLDFTNVNVDMEVADNALGEDEDKAIIRTGNDAENKTVTINLTGCNFDTTKASGVSGIVVMKNTHAEINLKDSTISTKDTYAIKVKKESGLDMFAMDNVKLTSATKAYEQNPIYNSDGHEISTQSTDAFNTYRAEAYKDTTYKTHGGAKYFEKNGADASIYSVPSEIVTEGNIFGGWYADEALGTALKMSDTSSENTVWAKMVPNHVMGVKAQLSKNLIDGDNTNDSAGTIRFVTTTDSLRYQEMGFRYSVVTEDEQTTILSGIKSSDQVYEEIYALEENGEVMNYLPNIFCTESEYFKTLIIENVPSAYFTAKITVQPFWITSDGTIVWGDEVTKTVQEGIEQTGWQSDNTTGFLPSNNEYTNRVILLSDLHYTTNLTYDEYMEKYGVSLAGSLYQTGPSYASGPAFGYSQSGKIGEALKDIDNFINAGNTINSVMVLGDMSLDDWGYRDYSKDQDDKGGYSGYLDDFAIDFMDVIVNTYENVSCYAIAGNHDNYTDGDDWNDILSQGTVQRNLGRQYSVEIGNAVFIMLDTFKDEAAYKWNDGGSGSEYLIEQEDVTFLQNELNKVASDKTIFLCAHYYTPADTAADDALASLIANDDRIVCMFQGHTHKNKVTSVEKLGGLPLVDIGGYAYNGSKADDGTYDFNIFDPAWAWGYQVLEWNDTEAHIYHVKNPRTYEGTNGTFNYKGAIENEMTFQF